MKDIETCKTLVRFSTRRQKHTHSLHLDKKTYQIHNINQFNINHSISFSNFGMLSSQILSDSDVSSHSSDIETSQKRRALPSKGRLTKSVKIETGWDHSGPFKIHVSHI
jgi:hypothetical protein